MKKYLILTLIIIAKTYLLSAQVELKTNPDSTKSKDSSIFVFTDIPANTIVNRQTEQSKTLKISPLALVRGEFPLFYETRINSRSSFEIGIGITTRDFYGEVFRDGLREKDADDNYSYPSHLDNVEKRNAGYMVRAAYKFYLDKRGKAISDNFFSPSITFKQYNYILKSEDNFLLSETKKEGLKFVELAITYGSQDVNRNDSFAFEWFLGLGVRKGIGDLVVYKRTEMGNTSIWSFDKKPNEYIAPYILGGIKIGISW